MEIIKHNHEWKGTMRAEKNVEINFHNEGKFIPSVVQENAINKP